MKPAQRKAARPTGAGDEDEVLDDTSNFAPPVEKFILVDGRMVIAEESRQVDFAHNIEARARDIDEAVVQSDERIYNYVNQNRIGKKAGLRTLTRWNDELTEKFYHGLRVFGTDFELISSLFGGGW